MAFSILEHSRHERVEAIETEGNRLLGGLPWSLEFKKWRKKADYRSIEACSESTPLLVAERRLATGIRLLGTLTTTSYALAELGLSADSQTAHSVEYRYMPHRDQLVVVEGLIPVDSLDGIVPNPNMARASSDQFERFWQLLSTAEPLPAATSQK